MYVLNVGAPPSPAVHILLVEDNPGDARLTARALGAAGWRGQLLVTPEGQEALELLGRQGEHADAPRPLFILLDLNLPGLSGRDVLGAIREDLGLRQLPVIVLSTSEAAQDVDEAYRGGANAYVNKPLDYGRFTEVARQLAGFWLDAAILPEG